MEHYESSVYSTRKQRGHSSRSRLGSGTQSEAQNESEVWQSNIKAFRRHGGPKELRVLGFLSNNALSFFRRDGFESRRKLRVSLGVDRPVFRLGTGRIDAEEVFALPVL